MSVTKFEFLGTVNGPSQVLSPSLWRYENGRWGAKIDGCYSSMDGPSEAIDRVCPSGRVEVWRGEEMLAYRGEEGWYHLNALYGDDHEPTPSQKAIAEVCDEVREMLLAKNRAYGNSALEPLRVFSKATTEEQILVRLDDKLSRLARGAAAGEDVVLDLIGYLVLLRVARRGG